MRAAWLAPVVFAIASCNASPATPPPTPGSQNQPPAPDVSTFHIAQQPPSAKDVIEAVMASGSLPLSASTNCANAGTDPSDATIGRYLAGFMAELSNRDKKNWIETKVEPGESATGEKVSVCTLTLRHEHGNDRWGWGLQFQVRASDGLVLPKSFSCVGAG